ncbi:MAG: YbaB/EbfC family nucleoid-associated protein [Anaerolineales bacterium]|jgi:DNA-binding protein YbaB
MAKGRKPPLPSSSGPAKPQHFRRLEEQIAQAQSLLAHETVTVRVGGGAVTIVMSGDQKCQSVEVSAEFLQSTEADVIGDLLKAAINQALEASRDLAARRLGILAGGLTSS